MVSIEVTALSNEDLVTEFGIEFWAADRCVGKDEMDRSVERLAQLRNEIIRRMEQNAYSA